MISLDLKLDTKTTSKLVLPKDTPKSTLSFASLLHGVQNQKGDSKLIQNGAQVLSLKETSVNDLKTKDTKSTTPIASLLQSDELKTLKEELSSLELNPEVTKDKTVAELKVIIKEAKQYLKNKITSLESFKKSDVVALPKTLKGLTQVAKKLGIDVSKITLEEVKQNVNVTKELPTQRSVVKTDAKQVESNTKLDKNPETTKVIKEANTQEIQKPVQTSKQVKTQQSVAVKTEKSEKQTQISEQIKTVQTEQKEQVQQTTTVKQTPLFKAQSKSTEITTQELVTAKMETNEVKKPQKQKEQNTLELLLRGNKALKEDVGMTPDFSVASAKVIAPSVTKEQEQSLESLLNGENLGETSHAKPDAVSVNKADSFEVKINEAKQMVKYLSNDIKQAIEDYKAPFTRVKVQLNPQKLGEIDLTVVQRGKNLHINLSSNNAAINTLAMNANDLKVQLTNNGIQNASLNFSNMSQGDQSGTNSQAHQQQQNRQNAQEEYGYFQNEEATEEAVNSLEIVVPHYA
ncbi:flagellar hook-length control protein FliK [Sulfurimonas sp.]|uniref:flagellar hook-length control protein FliK n=1 Tax=Sulfurimonas sp. TaxID=2022749 RepID=UPI003D11F90D